MSKVRSFFIIVLQTLFVIACMLPPYPLCWDMYVIPKWYAAFFLVYLGGMTLALCPKTRKWQLWRSGLAFAAAFGILFQLIVVTVEVSLAPMSVKSIGVSGTFDNPCGLAVSLCLLLPLVMYGTDAITCNGFCRVKLVFCCKVLLLLVAVGMVCATHSRTGIFTVLSYLLILICRNVKVRIAVKSAFVSVVLILYGLIAFSTKTASSNGRLFIMSRSLELVMQRPLVGHGSNSFTREYMINQARYFQQHPDSENGILADNIRHPLNEYILLWMDYGLAAPVLLLVTILFPMVYFRHYVIVNMLGMCLMLFCMFSYPLSYPLPFFVCLVLLGISVVRALKIKRRVVCSTCVVAALFFILWMSGVFVIDNLISSACFYSLHGKHNKAIEKYERLQTIYSCSPIRFLYNTRCLYFLYNYSRELFATGRSHEAGSYVVELENYIVDYDTRLLAGDISNDLGEYSKAMDAYKTASYMCPSRFAPLEGLLNCYIKTRRYHDAYGIAAKIVTKPVKIKNSSNPQLIWTRVISAESSLCSHA